jgi:hypothetical protein
MIIIRKQAILAILYPCHPEIQQALKSGNINTTNNNKIRKKTAVAETQYQRS